MILQRLFAGIGLTAKIVCQYIHMQSVAADLIDPKFRVSNYRILGGSDKLIFSLAISYPHKAVQTGTGSLCKIFCPADIFGLFGYAEIAFVCN